MYLCVCRARKIDEMRLSEIYKREKVEQVYFDMKINS